MKKKMMNKIIIAAAVAALFVIALGVMKSRIGGMVGKGNIGDLVIKNNSSETASSAFMRDGKMMSQVIKPGERTSGGRGLIRIFVAKKNGSYEIQYPYPRPVGKPMEISLTQIMDAARTPSMGQEMYTQKGMIEDIRVDYEEVRDLDATY